MTKWYTEKVFPWLMQKSIGKKSIMDLRREVLTDAYGKVLEIGIGTGINLSLYPEKITEITAVDQWTREIVHPGLKVNLVHESAEQMHFEDCTFDTVVSTFTLCSIKDLDTALREINRVLRPNGQFIFLEHGVSQNKTIASVQEWFNPCYNLFALGCNINRNYIEHLRKAGFVIEKYALKNEPIHPRILAGHVYKGIAKKKGNGGM